MRWSTLTSLMHKDQKIFLAGHRGLVGSAILRRLKSDGYEQIVTRTHGELDLTNQERVEQFFVSEQPEFVILAAGKVGGIYANNAFPAAFILENILIQAHVIDAAYRYGCKRFLFLGSSCIYPKFAPQPLKEEYLLTSALEPTNEAYAIAKIAGIKMCQAYSQQHNFESICVMPTNLYGPNDNFDLANSHVLPALIRKFHDAKTLGLAAVKIWGTGTPKREFLHADDLAEACLFLMKQPMEVVRKAAPDRIINVGVGNDITIADVAELIAKVVGYDGKLEYDPSKPDGTPRKLLDVSRINELGWRAKIDFREGIDDAYQWFRQNEAGLTAGLSADS